MSTPAIIAQHATSSQKRTAPPRAAAGPHDTFRTGLLNDAMEAHHRYTTAFLCCAGLRMAIDRLSGNQPGTLLILLWQLADAETALEIADRRHAEAAARYKDFRL